jgi:membrane fusion protein, multidrug efflux system
MKFYFGLLGALLLVACSTEEKTEEAVRPVFYQKISETTAVAKRTFAGISQAQSEAKLSFKVGGTLDNIYVKLGEKVKKGKILAQLNGTDYQLNLDKALAAEKSADAQKITAKSNFMRIESLYANNNASLSDYEKAKAQFESALAMSKTAHSQTSAAKNQLDYTKLAAPYEGTISAILAGENEMIGAGIPIVIFSSSAIIEIKTAVPENIISLVRPNQKVTIRFSTIDLKFFQGEISEIGLSAGSASTYPLIIKMLGAADQVLPGMACTIEFTFSQDVKAAAYIVISSDAVAHDESGDFVYVIKESEKAGIFIAKRKSIALGQLTSSGYEIKEGLLTDDIIVTAGLSFMYDGRKVKLLDNSDK